MITEVMALLIAVGAVMIFVVWNQSKKRRQSVEERREVEETTGKLKQEIEKTASEVIGRMENQVSSLEDLLDESEKNRTILEGRVAELRKLLKRSEGQSTEIRDLLTKLEEAGDTVEELQRKLEAAEKRIAMSMQVQVPMQMPMQPTMMPMSTPLMNPMMTPPIMTTPLPNVPSPISPPPILSSRQSTSPSLSTSSTTSSTPSSISTASTKAKITSSNSPSAKKMDKNEMKKALVKASAEMENPESKDFAKVLEKSMAGDKSNVKEEVRSVSRAPDRRSIVVPSRINQRATVVEREPVKIESQRNAPKSSNVDSNSTSREAVNKSNERGRVSDSVKIKNMLLEGMSVEDIAREMGVGRGAVELIQEMTRRQLERK